MDKNTAYAIARGYGFPITLSLEEMETLLEAFTNWLSDEDWDDVGEPKDRAYKVIMHKLQHRIAELKGG